MKLESTAAIVTGGASGLGAATAAALAERGVDVYVFDLPSAVARSADDGGIDGVTYVAVDVTSADNVKAGVERAAGGAVPLRTVVNCAGIGPSARILGKQGVHDLDLYAKVIGINLIGSFQVLALASAEIAKTDADQHGQRGVIISTASVAAFEG